MNEGMYRRKPELVRAWQWLGQEEEEVPLWVVAHFTFERGSFDKAGRPDRRWSRLLMPESWSKSVPHGHWLVLDAEDNRRVVSPGQFARDYELAAPPASEDQQQEGGAR